MSISQNAQRQMSLDINQNKNATQIEKKIKSVGSPGHGKLQTSMERLQVQQANVSRRAAGSNWLSSISQESGGDSENQGQQAASTSKAGLPATKSARARLKQKALRNRYVAMDCEMVGVGNGGQEDMLARVSIVNKVGAVLLDKYVKPRLPVVDYRTPVSGIRPHNIENAEEFDSVQDEVVNLLQGKILVGHGLLNDLAVLHIKHPAAKIRDTSRYKPLSKLVSNGHTPSLKRLTLAILGKEIQTGEHNSVEDARAAMGVYNRIATDWEKYIEKRLHK